MGRTATPHSRQPPRRSRYHAPRKYNRRGREIVRTPCSGNGPRASPIACSQSHSQTTCHSGHSGEARRALVSTPKNGEGHQSHLCARTPNGTNAEADAVRSTATGLVGSSYSLREGLTVGSSHSASPPAGASVRWLALKARRRAARAAQGRSVGQGSRSP